MMQLFRPEALRTQDRLYGDVQLIPPVSWQIVGYFLFVSVVGAGLFLAFATYTPEIRVSGRIVANRDIVPSLAPAAGTIDQILVGEGQPVAAGEPLARIRIATADDNANRTGENRATTLLVTAAASGIVTKIATRPGDPVAQDAPILSIMPAGTRLDARFDVPAEVAEAMPGDRPIHVAFDAFPSRIYGSVDARPTDVSPSASSPVRDGGSAMMTITAQLSRNAVFADGRAHPLHPGMTVSARIVTARRSLAGWLFDPAPDVARR